MPPRSPQRIAPPAHRGTPAGSGNAPYAAMEAAATEDEANAPPRAARRRPTDPHPVTAPANRDPQRREMPPPATAPEQSRGAGPRHWPTARVSSAGPPDSEAPRPHPSSAPPGALRASRQPSAGDPADRSTPPIPKPPQVPNLSDSEPSAEASRQAEANRQAMGRAEDRIKSLTTRTISLRSRLDQAEENLSARDEELAILREQHDSLRSLVAGRADRIRELEGQISDRNERIDELDTMVHKRDERIADLEERVRNLEQAQSEVPPPSDDLRAIYGIGPKVEARLREQGVTRYAQIAAWNDEDVAAMAELLKVHEKRIRRDDWIGSARELAGFDATSAPPEASSPEMGSAPDPPPASASDSVAQTLRDTDPPAASIPPPDLDGVDEGW